MQCPKCSADIRKTDKHCHDCGAAVVIETIESVKAENARLAQELEEAKRRGTETETQNEGGNGSGGGSGSPIRL